MPRTSILFISWAPHCSRSDSIARRLGGHSVMVYASWFGSNIVTAPLKYFVQTMWTLGVLLWHRPRAVLVMAPPVVACLPAWMYCVLFRARFGIDAHTGAFLDPRWKRLEFLQRFFSRRAETTIVTNDFLEELIESWGAAALIVPDVPVHFPEPEPVEFPSGCNMTVVASFCPDEPIREILSAASCIPDVNFYITGNAKKLDSELVQSVPKNICFLGFVSEARYTGQLLASDAVIALTTRDHTMQRAAYEAIYLGRPVITSDFSVLRQHFPQATVHVQPNATDIERGIREMATNLEQLSLEADALREAKMERWATSSKAICRCLRFNPVVEADTVESVSDAAATLRSTNPVTVQR